MRTCYATVKAAVMVVRPDFPAIKIKGDKGNKSLISFCIDSAGSCFLADKCLRRPFIDLGCSVGATVLLVLFRGGEVGGCEIQSVLLDNMVDIATSLDIAGEKLQHVSSQSMCDYTCPFTEPPVVWVCNPNLGDINYQTALQLLTYPVGTDVYTEIELFPCERGRDISVLYNDEKNPTRMLKRLTDELDVYTAVWNGGKQLDMLHYRVEELVSI